MRISAITRPAVSISAAADVIAGYVVAAPATPRPREALLTVPLLFAGSALLGAAGEIFYACFAVESGLTESAGAAWVLARAAERNRITLKTAFLMGVGLALAGIFAVMTAALTAGHLPVYAAGLLFLVGWARTARLATGYPSSRLPLVGGLVKVTTAGLRRALTLALGMSAHAELVYGQSAWRNGGALAAAGLYFAYGALAETLEDSVDEGGKRYTILVAAAGMLAVFGGSCVLFVGTSPALFAGVAGGVFLAARGLPAVRTLVPGAVSRLAEAAQLSGLFLAAAIAWGRWPTQGVVLVLGAVPLALVIPCAALYAREERVPVPRSARLL